jgi:hypothetical protein
MAEPVNLIWGIEPVRLLVGPEPFQTLGRTGFQIPVNAGGLEHVAEAG